jgi:hypothetical protein
MDEGPDHRVLSYRPEVIVRPKVTRAIALSIGLVSLIYLLLGSFALYGALSDGGHPILRSDLKQVVVGLIAYAGMMFGIVLVSYLAERRNRWVATDEGLKIYLGRREQAALDWSQVEAVVVRWGGIKLGAVAHGRWHTFTTYFTSREDGDAIREMWEQARMRRSVDRRDGDTLS